MSPYLTETVAAIQNKIFAEVIHFFLQVMRKINSLVVLYQMVHPLQWPQDGELFVPVIECFVSIKISNNLVIQCLTDFFS